MGLEGIAQGAQAQLSQRSGVPRTVISDYETDIRDVHNMTLDTAKSLACALDCHGL